MSLVASPKPTARSRSDSRAAGKPAAADPPVTGTLFHEPWWLATATNGSYHEARVMSGDQVVGRLPYVLSRHMGFTISRMPPFTHVLGPMILPGTGKPQTLLVRRLSIIRDLIDQLPDVAFFKQAFSPSLAEGLSLADGLGFQDRGFQVTPQYTFEIDCRQPPDAIWQSMHFKTRQHIRRAEEKFSVSEVYDPQAFMAFYLGNVQAAGRRSFIDFSTFPALYAETQARGCSEILCARWPDGRPAAMVVLVWGHGKMYYLLSTRARDEGDNGSINLLIWEAVKRAHERGLLFDLDGVSTSGTARFLSGFGGRLELRMIVQRTRDVYGALRYAKRRLGRGKANDTFAFT